MGSRFHRIFFPIQVKMSAIGYIRVSTAIQAEEGFSLNNQEKLIKEYCDKEKLELEKIYEDRGISGKSIVGRPGMMDLLRNLKPGLVVIFPSMSRLSRNTLDTLEIHKKLEENKCKMVILDALYNINDPSGKMMFTIISSFQQYERETIIQRIKSVMQRMSKDGTLKKKPSYGFRFVAKKQDFEPIEEEIKVIERILEMHKEGFSLCKIAKTLNAEGIPARKAKEWYHQVIGHIIRDWETKKE